MLHRLKIKELREKRMAIKLILFSFLLVLFSLKVYSQDSIPIAKDLTEEKELKFQQFFFKALSEKSIGNYQKAIENLESCNQILNDEVSVFFEFSKNYLQLNKKLLAKEYILRALNKDPNNFWMLKHLVKIHILERNYSEAIKIQQKIVVISIKEREFLLRLYLQNSNYKEAIKLMKVMESENALSTNFINLKKRLEKKTGEVITEDKTTKNTSFIAQFKTNKSFTILKKILEDKNIKTETLLKYANEGISLFPAQPYIYLVKGKALNYQKKYKKALLSLQNGIDFVIEDKMEANFYKEMAISYKGLGNFKEEKKFIEKSKKY